MKQVNIAQAKAQLSDLVNRANAGEIIFIARGNKPLVKLVAVVDTAVKVRKPGSAKGEVTFAEDFDAPLNDFNSCR